jgi:putative flippase GtrA
MRLLLAISALQIRFLLPKNILGVRFPLARNYLGNFNGGALVNLTRYVLVGIWNTFFGISTFILLSLFLKDGNSLLILGMSYIFSILQAHYSQRTLVWRSESNYLPELFKFMSFYFLQFILNAILLVVLNSATEIPREVNQILIILVLTIVFFYVNRNGVFNARHSQI